MVDVRSRKCRTEGCGKWPSFGVAGTRTMEYCAQHAWGGMVNVKTRKCRTEGCGKIPSFGVAGTKTREYCAQHAPDEMVYVCSRNQCRTEGCGKVPSFGVAGTRTVEYCAQHVPDGMVKFNGREKCRIERCSNRLSFEVTGTRKAAYCLQHTRPVCGFEGHNSKEIGSHHSDKETIGGAKRKTVPPFFAHASPPSDMIGGSCKRIKHLYITSTVSERVALRESAAGAVTTPKIDRQKSPIKRDSSVKTEAHLSL